MRFIVYRLEHFVKTKVSEKYDYIGNICGVSPQNKTKKKTKKKNDGAKI